MSRDDLENLLRNHLASELDSQRGRAAQAFEAQVIKPMQSSLLKRSRNWYTIRAWSIVGAAMAACIVIGYSVPHYFNNNSKVETFAEVSESSSTPIENKVVDFNPGSYQQTSIKQSTDGGAVMLQNQQPGRKILLQELNHYTWTEPSTGGRMEVIVPSQKNLYLQVHQQ